MSDIEIPDEVLTMTEWAQLANKLRTQLAEARARAEKAEMKATAEAQAFDRMESRWINANVRGDAYKVRARALLQQVRSMRGWYKAEQLRAWTWIQRATAAESALSAAVAERERARTLLTDTVDVMQAVWDTYAIKRPDGTSWAGGMSVLDDVMNLELRATAALSDRGGAAASGQPGADAGESGETKWTK